MEGKLEETQPPPLFFPGLATSYCIFNIPSAQRLRPSINTRRQRSESQPPSLLSTPCKHGHGTLRQPARASF